MGRAADKVIEIISERLGVSPSSLTPGTSFANDLGADSLDAVELVMEFEDEFDLNIPDQDAERIRTVGDAIRYIEASVGGSSGAAALASAPPKPASTPRLAPAGRVADGMIEIVSNVLGVPKTSITPSSSFADDLGADSLQAIELLACVEVEFDIEVDEDDVLERITTVGEAIRYVERRLAGAPHRAATASLPGAAPSARTAPTFSSDDADQVAASPAETELDPAHAAVFLDRAFWGTLLMTTGLGAGGLITALLAALRSSTEPLGSSLLTGVRVLLVCVCAVAACAFIMEYLALRRLRASLAPPAWERLVESGLRWLRWGLAGAILYLGFGMFIPAAKPVPGAVFVAAIFFWHLRLVQICAAFAAMQKSAPLAERAHRVERQWWLLLAEAAGLPVIAGLFYARSPETPLVPILGALVFAFLVYSLIALLVLLRQASSAMAEAEGQTAEEG